MKKSTRILAIVLAVVMVLGTVALAAGEYLNISVVPGIQLSVDGKTVTPTNANGEAIEVFAYKEATYLPLRYISELLGVNIGWDQDTQTATVDTAAPAFETTVEWDAEYDVVVVGFGGAGAVTSITAADEGAKVLLLEKAPQGQEGGNTRVSGQGILSFNDFDLGMTYYKNLLGEYDTVSDAIVETYVRGCMENPDWLKSIGAAYVGGGKYAEYPELEGSESSASAMLGMPNNSAFYQLLHKNVEQRSDNIDVWYGSPGVELIQDPETKIIHGIKVDMQGQMVNVRAINGVVLTCGGFENNEEMVENYLQMPYCFSKGADYNTGDGITMAAKVGAKLWHMSAISGPDVNFKSPDMNHTFGYNLTGEKSNSSAGFMVTSAILVGSDGTRFCDETFKTRHGHVSNHGTWVSMQIPAPSFMIFDESARLAGRPIYATWSLDSSEEIEKGWIIKAETLDELAELTGIDAEGLKAEITFYNESCAAGKDIVHGRPEQYLVPISETGPYYAMEVVPSVTNTQGGPERNENAEVLDWDGNPIPHLYAAGELGSIHADIYQGMGNLGECIVFGRIAGANAVKVKDDVTQESLLGGKEGVAPAKADGEVAVAEGEYLGEGTGMGGRLVVKVKVADGKIESVEIVSHHETPNISDRAIAELPGIIQEAGSAEVDNISGATVSSTAIKAAVEDALSQVNK